MTQSKKYEKEKQTRKQKSVRKREKTSNLLVKRMAEIICIKIAKGEGGSSANGRPKSLTRRRSEGGEVVKPVGRSRSECARRGICSEAERRKGKGSHGNCVREKERERERERVWKIQWFD